MTSEEVGKTVELIHEINRDTALVIVEHDMNFVRAIARKVTVFHQGKIFAEDLEMLERQQQNLLAYPERKLLMLNIDSGGVQSRRVIDRLLAAEKTFISSLSTLEGTTAKRRRERR